MTLTLALAAIAALLALAALAILVGGTAWGRGLIYGGALLICAMSGAAALFQLVGGAATPSATLPLGLPWLGAHFRMDALSAFFAAPVFLLAAVGAVYGEAYWPWSQPRAAYVRCFFAVLSGALALVMVADNTIFFLAAWPTSRIRAPLAPMTIRFWLSRST